MSSSWKLKVTGYELRVPKVPVNRRLVSYDDKSYKLQVPKVPKVTSA